MIMRLADKTPREREKGCHLTVMGHTPNLMVVEVILERGTAVAPHQHVHEQISYVLRGSVKFSDGEGGSFVLEAGESCTFAAQQPHGATALSDALIVDAFAPARRDFL